MSNYSFLDAYASVKTAASSTIGGVEYPIVKVPDTISVSVVGVVPVTFSGSPSISGAVNVGNAPSVYGNISGSVIAFQGGTWVPSAIGYAYRNDTLASTLGADQTYGVHTRDSAGRLVIKPFAADDSATFSVSTSVVSTSVTLLKASVAGKRSYVTDFFISNTGATTTAIQFKDGNASVIGQTIAPTGGGSNAPGLAVPLKTAPSQDLAFTGLSATSVLYVTVNGYQAP